MEKAVKEVTAEIQAIVRQITASVTFLPLLNDPCAPSSLIAMLVMCGMLASHAESESTVAHWPHMALLRSNFN